MASISTWILAGALALSFGTTTLHAQSHDTSGPLSGKKLRYKIGADHPGNGRADEIVEVGYDWSKPLPAGITIAYCNLFNEKYSEQSPQERNKYAPYLKTSDTAEEYGEGQIDPRGPGWWRNLTEQFERRKRQGFEYIELDNPDAYSVADVIGAVELAGSYGLKVIAKNPKLMEGDALPYVVHPNVYGIIVEKGAGDAHDMDTLRRRAGKPDLPVWFVFFDAQKGHIAGRTAAKEAAGLARQYASMHVTYSPGGEYVDALDQAADADARINTKQARAATGTTGLKTGRVREANNLSLRNTGSRAQ